MSNIKENEFNKNVAEVYTEEPGFTGYKGLDFGKIDDNGSNISNYSPKSINGIAVSGNAFRKEFLIQNLSTEVLYVKYGENASSASFNIILPGSSDSNAGDGGVLTDLNYTGVVSVSGQNASYISWERTL